MEKQDWKITFKFWYDNHFEETEDFDKIFNQIWFFKLEWINSIVPEELWDFQVKWINNFKCAWYEYDLNKKVELYNEEDAFKLIWIEKKTWFPNAEDVELMSELVDIWENVLI